MSNDEIIRSSFLQYYRSAKEELLVLDEHTRIEKPYICFVDVIRVFAIGFVRTLIGDESDSYLLV